MEIDEIEIEQCKAERNENDANCRIINIATNVAGRQASQNTSTEYSQNNGTLRGIIVCDISFTKSGAKKSNDIAANNKPARQRIAVTGNSSEYGVMRRTNDSNANENLKAETNSDHAIEVSTAFTQNHASANKITVLRNAICVLENSLIKAENYAVYNSDRVTLSEADLQDNYRTGNEFINDVSKSNTTEEALHMHGAGNLNKINGIHEHNVKEDAGYEYSKANVSANLNIDHISIDDSAEASTLRDAIGVFENCITKVENLMFLNPDNAGHSEAHSTRINEIPRNVELEGFDDGRCNRTSSLAEIGSIMEGNVTQNSMQKAELTDDINVANKLVAGNLSSNDSDIITGVGNVNVKAEQSDLFDHTIGSSRIQSVIEEDHIMQDAQNTFESTNAREVSNIDYSNTNEFVHTGNAQSQNETKEINVLKGCINVLEKGLIKVENYSDCSSSRVESEANNLCVVKEQNRKQNPNENEGVHRFNEKGTRRIPIKADNKGDSSAKQLQTQKDARCTKVRNHPCKYCEYKASQAQNLKKHIDAVHLKIKKYKCSDCDYSATQSHRLRSHVDAMHLKIQHHACQLCKYKASTKGNLKIHVDAVHKKIKNNECSECNYKCGSSGSLKVHNIAVHKQLKNHSCNLCDYKSSHSGNLKLHVDSVHRQIGKYSCSECNHITSTLQSIKRHMDTVHKQNMNHSCNLCDYNASQACEIKKHIAAVHIKIKKFSCDQCDYKASRIWTLKIHVNAVHNNVKNHICSECGYSSTYSHHVKAHMNAVHIKIEKFVCVLCDFKTSYAGALKSHVDVVHKQIKNHACRECEHKSSRASNLKKHVDAVHRKIRAHVDAVHRKIKPYECGECDYKSASAAHLKSHIDSVHRNMKEHMCIECDYKANQSQNLKEHVTAVHRKVKSHACSKCDYRSARAGSLKIHIDAVHKKIKSHACCECNFRSATAGSLKKHIDEVHMKIKNNVCNLCDYSTSRPGNLKMHVNTVHKQI